MTEWPDGISEVNTGKVVEATSYVRPPEPAGYPELDEPVCKIVAVRVNAKGFRRGDDEELYPDGSAKYTHSRILQWQQRRWSRF